MSVEGTAFNIVGMQQITLGSDAAVGLTVPSAARHACIAITTFGVRLGSATTVPVASTSGVTLAAAGFVNYTDASGDFRGVLTQLRLCNAVAGSNAVIDVMYFN
jgi:hypothetical protein